MKTKVILLTILFWSFYGEYLNAQNLFYDSKKVADALQKDSCLNKATIENLKEIYNFQDSTLKKLKIQSCTDKIRLLKNNNNTNPKTNSDEEILQISHDIIQTERVNSNPPVFDKSTGIANLIPSLSAPSILIDGASQFLVERTKQELNIAFIDKFRNAFNNNEDFKMLFPSVSNVVLYNDPLNFSTWGQQLQIATKTDIVDLPNSFPIYFKNQEDYKKLEPKQKELMESSFIVLQSLIYQKNGYHPVEVVQLLKTSYGYMQNNNQTNTLNINKVISFADALRESFFIPSTNSFVSRDSILSILKNQIHRDLFMAMFSNKYKTLLNSINVTNSSLYVLFNDTLKRDFVNEFFNYSAQLSSSFRKIKPAIDSLSSPSASDSIKRIATKVVNNFFFNLYDIGFKLNFIGKPIEYLGKDGWHQKYRPVVKNAIELNNYLLEKNYKAAMLSLSNIMIPVLNEIINNIAKDKRPQIYRIKSTLNNLVYWGGFLTEFTSIEKEGDFKNLLTRYAEPVGSYRIKRYNEYSVSLNSYPGFFIGRENETLVKVLSNSESTYKSIAITAPVGLSLNVTNPADKNINSIKKYTNDVWGLYIPIIDIGAPFAYRWSNSEGGFPENLKWSQIFAPGLYLTYGFKDSGLTLMAGGQHSPELRSITDADNIVLKKDAVRFGLTICYDIPIFTLFKTEGQ